MLKPPSDKITAETREKLLALAEFIEADQKHGFWMAFIDVHGPNVSRGDRPGCGSAGCLIGFSNWMHGVDEDRTGFELRYSLAPAQVYDLCLPSPPYSESSDRAKAVRVLRHFAFSGEVDWSV